MKLFLLLLFLSVSLFSNNFTPINIDSSHHYIGKSTLIYEDTTASMNVKNIQKVALNDFFTIKNDTFSSIFTSSVFWHAFEIENTQTTPISRLFVIGSPWFDYIQINVISPTGELTQYNTGNILPHYNRSIEHNIMNQRHLFAPGISRVYIKSQTRDPFVCPISIVKEDEFIVEQLDDSKSRGIIYGVLIAMVLYNFLLFVGIRVAYLGYYVLFVVVFLIMNNSYNGYIFQYLLPNQPELQNWINSISIVVFSLCYLLFARAFLELKHEHQKLNLTTLYIIYFMIIMTIITAFVGGYRLNVITSILFVSFTSIYIFVIAIYSWFQGNYAARFFILGSIGGLIGTFMTAITVMGQIPYSNLGYRALDYGMLLDAILLSLALADKIRISREEKNAALAEARVAHVEKIMAEKLSNIDPLTGLLNRRAYDEIVKSESARSSRYHLNTSVIFCDVDDFKTFNDQYGHEFGDDVLIHLAKILKDIKREYDYIFRLGGDEFIIFLPQTSLEEATTVAQRLKAVLEVHQIHREDKVIPVVISCGIAQFNNNDISIADTVKRADKALYTAKSMGKNRCASSYD